MGAYVDLVEKVASRRVGDDGIYIFEDEETR